MAFSDIDQFIASIMVIYLDSVVHGSMISSFGRDHSILIAS